MQFYGLSSGCSVFHPARIRKTYDFRNVTLQFFSATKVPFPDFLSKYPDSDKTANAFRTVTLLTWYDSLNSFSVGRRLPPPVLRRQFLFVFFPPIVCTVVWQWCCSVSYKYLSPNITFTNIIKQICKNVYIVLYILTECIVLYYSKYIEQINTL